MITGLFHSGSGLGNQLHRYVATRVLAIDKGYDFSMVAPENFKGWDVFKVLHMSSFPNVYPYPHHTEMPSGKIIVDVEHKLWEEKTNYYNPESNFIEDNTIIDGEFQDERYFGHRMKEIDEWLKIEPIEIPNNTCVIGFRGGEYYLFPELGLPKSYFEEGIEIMKSRGVTKFEVHTDDVDLAQQFFPDYRVVHDIGINWRSMRHAKYAIIANSSFFILPRLLSGGTTIAPRYWARRNTKEWSMPQNYYKEFLYI